MSSSFSFQHFNLVQNDISLSFNQFMDISLFQAEEIAHNWRNEPKYIFTQTWDSPGVYNEKYMKLLFKFRTYTYRMSNLSSILFQLFWNFSNIHNASPAETKSITNLIFSLYKCIVRESFDQTNIIVQLKMDTNNL